MIEIKIAGDIQGIKVLIIGQFANQDLGEHSSQEDVVAVVAMVTPQTRKACHTAQVCNKDTICVQRLFVEETVS